MDNPKTKRPQAYIDKLHYLLRESRANMYQWLLVHGPDKQTEELIKQIDGVFHSGKK